MLSRRTFLASLVPALTRVNLRGTKLVAFGDSGSGSDEQRQLARWMAREEPSLAIHTGDLAYPLGTRQAYQDLYFAPYRELMSCTPFYPCPGNHDYVDDGADDYRALMRVPVEGVPEADRGLYYSFDWGEAHFASLDTNDPLWQAVERKGPMLRWLEADLARSDALWKIAFFHHTPYATGPHEGSPAGEMVRRHLVPVLEKHGVQVVFAGHEHSYQRSHPIRGGVVDAARGILYITTGGGGGGLYPAPPALFQARGLSAYHFVCAEIEGPRMHLRALGLEGEQLDAFTLSL